MQAQGEHMDDEYLEVKTDWDSHERSVGPVKGYYLALCAYREAEADGRYRGFYKICAGEPDSYWDAICMVKGCTDTTAGDAQTALREAEALARQDAANLPAPGLLGAYRERRPLNVLERSVLGVRRGS
jgi:hypothetical protein